MYNEYIYFSHLRIHSLLYNTIYSSETFSLVMVVIVIVKLVLPPTLALMYSVGLGRPPDAWVLGELLPSEEG